MSPLVNLSDGSGEDDKYGHDRLDTMKICIWLTDTMGNLRFW